MFEVKKKIKSLKDKNSFEDINEIILRDRKATIKQKAVDLFSEIELNGYSCEINWFFDLSGRRLKELYKQLEDLVDIGVYECEKYYPAFQLVLFEDSEPSKALSISTFDTIGQA